MFKKLGAMLSNERGEVAVGGGDPAVPAVPAAAPVDPAAGSFPGHVQPPATLAVPAANDFASMIPDEYKEKAWVKETKDLPGLLKRTDNLISELGKQPGAIPQENAKPEEWQAFNKALGVPEKPEGYEFAPLPEGVEADAEWQAGIQKMLHSAGVSARQFKAIEPMWNDMMTSMNAKSAQSQEQMNIDFDKLADATFGENKGRALANSKAMIDKYTPDSLKQHVANLSNENLIVMSGVLTGIIKEYVGEDSIPGGGGGAVGASGEAGKRAEALAIMSSEAFKNAWDPKHKEAVAKVEAIYGSLKK